MSESLLRVSNLRIEFSRGRFHAIDLDSTNGTLVNGIGVVEAELVHGDRIQAGAHVFQLLFERNEARPWQRWRCRAWCKCRIAYL